MLYSRSDSPDISDLGDVLSFFLETAPCGVLGNFILDTCSDSVRNECDVFEFKHHYMTEAIESDFLCRAFAAIRSHRFLLLTQTNQGGKGSVLLKIVPLMVYKSTQGGRMYLMAYNRHGRYFMPLRFDYILSMEIGEVYEGFEEKRAQFEEIRKHIWGVALKRKKKYNEFATTHVGFTVCFGNDEAFIYRRLLREKRFGEVTLIDKNTARFEADIFDAQEIVPWARTFISRITEFWSSDGMITRKFYDDIRKMKKMYGIGLDSENPTGASDAVQ